jgi:hypothetical protein
MRQFYQAFPIRDALRRELSRTHYRSLLRVEDAAARHCYMAEACAQNWGTRALERQIGTLYYERRPASRDRKTRSGGESGRSLKGRPTRPPAARIWGASLS